MRGLSTLNISLRCRSGVWRKILRGIRLPSSILRYIRKLSKIRFLISIKTLPLRVQDNEEDQCNAHLGSCGIPYSSIEYAWDEEHLDAVTAAHKLNIEPDMLFKTIVMISEDNEVFVFCVPAPAEVSLKSENPNR